MMNELKTNIKNFSFNAEGNSNEFPSALKLIF
jgi:hypothetical protein